MVSSTKSVVLFSCLLLICVCRAENDSNRDEKQSEFQEFLAQLPTAQELREAVAEKKKKITIWWRTGMTPKEQRARREKLEAQRARYIHDEQSDESERQQIKEETLPTDDAANDDMPEADVQAEVQPTEEVVVLETQVAVAPPADVVSVDTVLPTEQQKEGEPTDDTQKGPEAEPETNVEPVEQEGLWAQVHALTLRKAILLSAGAGVVCWGAYELYRGLKALYKEHMQAEQPIRLTADQHALMVQFTQAIDQQNIDAIKGCNIQRLPSLLAHQLGMLQEEYCAIHASTKTEDEQNRLRQASAAMGEVLNRMIEKVQLVEDSDMVELSDEQKVEELIAQMLKELHTTSE